MNGEQIIIVQYVYSSIIPSLTFDPYDPLDMVKIIKSYLCNGAKPSVPLIENRIQPMIDLLLREGNNA